MAPLAALTTRSFAAIVLAASLVVLGTALLSQYWGGLSPCELCLLQRWPWWAAIVVSLIACLLGRRLGSRWAALMLAAVFLVSAGFAAYHVGVEQHWLAGPTACTASAGSATTLEELKRQIAAQPPVLCDSIQWSLFGISLAGWNLVASLIMLAGCLAAVRRSRIAA